MQQPTLGTVKYVYVCLLSEGAVGTAACLTPDLISAPGVQGAQHDHHQLLRTLPEGGVHRGPGDHQARGRVWLRLQQRAGSAHVQQHELRLLPQPVPGAPQSVRCSGAEARRSDHTQSTSPNLIPPLFIAEGGYSQVNILICCY